MHHLLSLSFLPIWCRLHILISVELILSPRSVMNMLNNADSSTKPHWPPFLVRCSDIHNPLLFSECFPVVFNFSIDYFPEKIPWMVDWMHLFSPIAETMLTFRETPICLPRFLYLDHPENAGRSKWQSHYYETGHASWHFVRLDTKSHWVQSSPTEIKHGATDIPSELASHQLVPSLFMSCLNM